MGKSSKKFNWKARQVKESVVDDSETNKIKLDLIVKEGKGFDASNPLVLPSQKRKTQIKKNAGGVSKILSRKQRKKLEKIVEKKTKKEKRAELLKSLSEVQAQPHVMSELTSITYIQSQGLKRVNHIRETGSPSSRRSAHLSKQSGSKSSPSINSILGSKKRKTLLNMEYGLEGKKLKDGGDLNVVGFQESDGSSDNDSISETEIQKNETENKYEEKNNALEIKLQAETSQTDSGLFSSCELNSQTISVKDSNVDSNIVSENSDANNLKGSAPKILREPPRPAVFVPVNRKNSIQEARLKLPVLAEEQVIMEAISENQVVIIAGETGSGKTTQVPQFLYEAGYARDRKVIGVTEPRRVAAMSMAKRVAEEMDLSSEKVSYLIRFEGNVTDDTHIKFMTDGVLLKEIQNDFLLTKYSVIILDEAHERSVYTDILVGLLSRIVPLRMKRKNPLKLVIMSATLRLEDFTENPRLFRETPPVIKVETRQYPVTIHFNKRTNPDYCSEAFRKACKIHTKLPEGGILIFLTGQQEVKSVVRKLQRAFPMKPGNRRQTLKKVDQISSSVDEDIELDMERAIFEAKRNLKKKQSGLRLPNINLDEYSVMPSDDTEADLFGEDDVSDSESEDVLDIDSTCVGAGSQPLWVLPLYSVLPSHEQAKVFQPPPDGCRLCVVATNVAETSITIPNVTYVVDCGKWKSRMYDKITGVSSFKVEWCSKASANQRAGRAGRTGPGHCYRLYSSAVFNDSFPLFATPEIQRKPVDDLVLQMKAMNIHKVFHFPFPSAPDILQIKAAERRLRVLGALQPPSPGTSDDDCCAKLSPLGQAIATFPVAPRFGKMLALSHQHDLLALTICLVAALSVQEVLLDASSMNSDTSSGNIPSQQTLSAARRKWAGAGNSLMLGDPMVLLRAVGACEFAASKGDLMEFCERNCLRHKAMMEIRKLRVQLTNEINLNVPNLCLCVDPSMPPPSDLQAKLLRQVLLSGLVDQVARRIDPEEIKEAEDKRKWKYAYQTPDMDEPVFLHPSSVLRKELPQWVVYQEIFETNKMYIRGRETIYLYDSCAMCLPGFDLRNHLQKRVVFSVTAIEPEWLPVFAPALCNISDPILDPPPRYDPESERLLCHMSCTFGRSGWPLPVVELDFPEGLNRYKWFARFFLDGKICPKLSKFVKSLLSTPETMTKTWANLQPRTEVFLKTLLSEHINSPDKLWEMWKKDPKYLLEAYKQWLPESAHLDAIAMWPPCLRSSHQKAKD